MKKQFSNFQLDSLIYFIMHACVIGLSFNNMLFISKQNSPIAVIFAALIGFIPIFILLYIMNYRPNLSIIELNEELFGKKIGLFINILLVVFALTYGVVIFYNLCNFINSQYLYRTPMLMIGIIFSIGIWYMLSKGLPVFMRVVQIIVYADIILFSLSFFGLIGQIDLENLKPILNEGIAPVITGSFQYITYNILPLFLLTIIPKKEIKKDNHFNQHMIYTYIIVNIVLFTILFCTTSIIGVELAQIYQYAEFHILKRVSILGFITRVENTLSLQWIFDMLITNAFVVYFVMEGIKRIWKTTKEKNDHIILAVLVISILLFSQVIFPTNTDAYQILSKVYPFLLAFFFFVIPFGIMLKIYFTEKKDMKKSHNNSLQKEMN